MRINLNDDEGIEVQMAPLIDCVFLLLVFFLVTSTIKKIDKELPLELPEPVIAGADVQLPADILVVSVDAEGQLFLGSQPITSGMLQQELKLRAAEDPEQPLRLNADRMAPWSKCLQVMELAKFEGLTNVRPALKRN